jgi:cytochrome c oxidase subunit 1
MTTAPKTTAPKVIPYAPPADVERDGLPQWLLTTDHKRLGILTIGTALVMFVFNGLLALTMRTQLAQPNMHVLGPQEYLQFVTQHGSGMVTLTITPLAIGLGMYLVPLQIGAPRIAAPRVALLGYWFYVFAAVLEFWGFGTPNGGASSGWWGYTPLSTARYTPGFGQSMWAGGMFMAAVGMILMGSTILYTILRMRAPGVTMMRMPLFSWTQTVTNLMVIAAFAALAVAALMVGLGRIDPGIYESNGWNIAYENIFWFYGHPVVYVMFFPFVGCVEEVLAVFSGRRFFAYKGTVLAQLIFSTGSMAVWGHHLFNTGQTVNDYFSVTSLFLSIPAGIEYFGFIGTLFGGRHRFTTPMLFALAFIPQFAIGGLTGILVANPAIDYQMNNSYFILGHFHYTLFAGSVFGFFAGFYYWFPKATGIMLRESVGKLNFALMVIGTNMTFLPMFFLGMRGLPRWVVTYPAGSGFSTLQLISSIGAGIIGMSFCVFFWNIYTSVRRKKAAGPNPWQAFTLEWATSSPPPRFNFNLTYPVPQVHSYAPLLDLREQRERAAQAGPVPKTTAATRPGTPAGPASQAGDGGSGQSDDSARQNPAGRRERGSD